MPKPDMTEEVRIRYVEQGSQRCPFCGSGQIATTSNIESDFNEAWQTVQCFICQREWRDYYKLTGVEAIDLND